jgi:putative addiction module component (TIGR02574 family)
MHDIDDIDFSALSSTERLQLAQVLLDSVLYDARTELFSDQQLADLDRRVADIESGRSISQSWESAKQQF